MAYETPKMKAQLICVGCGRLSEWWPYCPRCKDSAESDGENRSISINEQFDRLINQTIKKSN